MFKRKYHHLLSCTYFVLNKAALTAMDAASNRLPPHSNNWNRQIPALVTTSIKQYLVLCDLIIISLHSAFHIN